MRLARSGVLFLGQGRHGDEDRRGQTEVAVNNHPETAARQPRYRVKRRVHQYLTPSETVNVRGLPM
ncbi:hypothetical protein ACMYR2_3425 [Nitrobacter sp. TKz-YC01]